MKVKSIFVLGAGTMGNGIAQVAATSGYQVVLMDIIPEQLKRAKIKIDKSTEKLVEKGKLEPSQRDAAKKITYATNLDTAPMADLIIEAATENLDLKLKLFHEMDQVANPESILATNTSSISITKIAAPGKDLIS